MDYSRLNYFILLVAFGFMFFLFRAKPKPTYDPFDDLLRVDVEQLMDDGCEHAYLECLGPRLRYEAKAFYIDYCLDGYEELNFVSARASIFPLDTLAKKYFVEENYHLRDTIPIPSTALSKFDETIGKFGFEIDTIFEDRIQIFSPIRGDTIVLEQWNSNFHYDSLIIRQYWYHVETPLNFEQKLRKLFVGD